MRIFLILLLLAGIGIAGWVFVDPYAAAMVVQAGPQVIGIFLVIAALLIGGAVATRGLAPILVAVVMVLAAAMLGIGIRADIGHLAPKTGQQPLATVSTEIKLISVDLAGAPDDSSKLIAWLREERPDVVVLRGRGEPVVSVLSLSDLFAFVAPFPAESVTPETVPPIMVLSRLPIDKVEILDPGPSSAALVTAAIELGGATLAVYAVATGGEAGMAGLARREQQLRALAPGIERDTRPVILAGGLDLAPWSRAVRDLANEAGLAMIADPRAIVMAGTVPGFLPPPLALSADPMLSGHGARMLEYRSGPDVDLDRRPIVGRFEVAASRPQS